MNHATDGFELWLGAEFGRRLADVTGDPGSPRYAAVPAPVERRRRPGLVIALAAAAFAMTGGIIAATASVGSPPPVVTSR